jgi:threonine/homoserine/homoserine lactone efflux protein
MHDAGHILLFVAAALVIALTPGPGMFYVAARTLAGGRREGLASSIGTGLGGMVHIVAGAVGVSALVMASAEAFAILKLAGGVYLVWLGVKTIREARLTPASAMAAHGARQALRDGIIVEALNPKTAAFFLAFIPQFVDPSQDPVALQFAMFGAISVGLNTAADIAVVLTTAKARDRLVRRPGLIRRLRQASGAVICGLGVSLAFARRTAP